MVRSSSTISIVLTLESYYDSSSVWRIGVRPASLGSYLPSKLGECLLEDLHLSFERSIGLFCPGEFLSPCL